MDGAIRLDVGDRWYVVHAHARGEETARCHLARQGFTAFLPQYLKRRRHARRTDWIRTPLFPRYLFVAMDVASTRWRAISSTFGVSHLICNGETPTPVPHGIIEDIQVRLGGDGLVEMKAEIPFKKGEVVRVTSGAMASQTGLFDCAEDADRVFLLLDLMGRQVRVKVPLDAVEPYL